MAPVSYIAIKPGQLPCNCSEAIIIVFHNSTSAQTDNGRDDYDSAGAMKFIVTTLMVYSLMGITGLLFLRIRRRASRTHRVVTIREEDLQQYIKQADDLKLAGYRHKLKMDAARMVHHLQRLESQRSYTRSNSERAESAHLLDPTLLSGYTVQTADSKEDHSTFSSSGLCAYTVQTADSKEDHTTFPSSGLCAYAVQTADSKENHSTFSSSGLCAYTVQTADSKEDHPTVSSSCLHEPFVLPPLLDELTDVKSNHSSSNPVSCTRFCNTCGAPLNNTLKRYKSRVTWAQTSYSPTCSNNNTIDNSNSVIAVGQVFPMNAPCPNEDTHISAV